jgi:hypothetical protein
MAMELIGRLNVQAEIFSASAKTARMERQDAELRSIRWVLLGRKSNRKSREGKWECLSGLGRRAADRPSKKHGRQNRIMGENLNRLMILQVRRPVIDLAHCVPY